MLENLLKRKYLIKNLYVATPGLVTRSESDNCYYYNETEQELDIIVVKKIDEYYVLNILNGRKYGIFSKFAFISSFCKYEDQYMVNMLQPLEIYLTDKTKKTITKQELIEFLSNETKQKDETLYRDVIVQKISEQLSRVNNSNVNEEEKEKLRYMLLEIVKYYQNSLQNIDKSLNIVDLRIECLRRLSQFEMMLSPEYINNSIDELESVKKEIEKIKYIFK